MAKDLQTYYGVRAALIADGSGPIFDGWVVEATSRNVVVRIEGAVEIKKGTSFDVELFGREYTARFEATYVGFERSSIYQLLKSGKLQSAAGIDLEYFDVEHRFVIASAPTFLPMEDEFRVSIAPMKIGREFFAMEIEMELVNVGEDHIGCYSQEELELESKHRLKVGTPYGEVELDALVVACEAIHTVGDHFRVTFALAPIGRINSGKWSRFVAAQGSPI